jgi:ADP-L-glycero-D-manno-heptose-6-epimerase
MKKIKCLVTGGTGFIGYNLTKQLQKDGHEVLITGRTGKNSEGVNDLIVGYNLFGLDWDKIGNIDILFHQAAIVDTTNMDLSEMISINVEASKLLFEQAVKHGCKHIIYASSVATYGNEETPYIERITKQNSLNPYGESKKLLEEFAIKFSKKHPEVKIVGLRYCNVYGPYDKHKGKMRCYLSQLADQMRIGNPKLFTNGEQKRDYTYIKDIVRANILASKSKESCILNCGSGKAVSFNYLVTILNDRLNLNRNPEYIENPYKKAYQNHTECDMSLAKEKIGFIPEYSVEMGINEMYGNTNQSDKMSKTIHDFTLKLRQSSMFPQIMSYINWQRKRGASTSDNEKSVLEFWKSPISINLDLTTACNFRCGHCIDSDILNGKTKFDHSQLLASLENMIQNGLRSVILIGGGEPTLYQKFKDIVRFLKERSIQIAIVSNGSRNEYIYEIANTLTEKDWVRLSLDAGTNDTFVKMHKPRNNVSLEKICSWIPKIRERNPKLSVGFSFIISWKRSMGDGKTTTIPNIDEIVTATKLAQESGFSYISFKPLLDRYPHRAEVINPSIIVDFDKTMLQIRKEIDIAKTYETENFKIIESTNLKALESGSWEKYWKQPQTCHIQVIRQILSPNGLFNCPAHRDTKSARIADANIFSDKNNLDKIQNALTSMLDNFDASKECSGVTCIYNQVNWWIDKAINSNINPIEYKNIQSDEDFFF